MRKSLGLLSLLVLIGFVSLGSVDNAYAHSSTDLEHQRLHLINELLQDDSGIVDDTPKKNSDFVKFSEFTSDDLLPGQTITEKRLIEFYEINEMIEDFGDGRLAEKFTSTGTAKVWQLRVVVHTEAEKAETIIVNTNYEIIKSYSEVYTPEDYNYLEFVNELPNEIALAIILGPLTFAAVFINRDRRLDEESSAVKIISSSFVMIILVTGLGFAFPAVIAQAYWGVPFASAEEQDIDQAEQDFVPPSSEKDSAQQSLLPEAKESIQFDNSDKDNQSLHGDSIIVTYDNPYLSLDGNDYVEITSSSLPNKLQTLTVSAWVKPNYDKGSSELYIVSKDGAFSLSINNVIEPERKAAFSVFDGLKWHMVNSKSDVKPDQWTYITATFDGSSIDIYLNGFRENSLSLKNVVSGYYEDGVYKESSFDEIESDSEITLGAYMLYRDKQHKIMHKYAGQIDDVRFYDLKLTSAQISEVYNNQRQSDAPPTPEPEVVILEEVEPAQEPEVVILEDVENEFSQLISEANQYGFVAEKENDDAQEIEEKASKGFKVEKKEKKKKTILTVITNVINDDGGSAVASDFRMSVSGNDPIPESFPGDEKGVIVSLNAGSFSVFESALDGYTQSFSADCSGTIELYGKKTCTVTNDDVHQYSTSTVVTTGSDPSTESSDTTTDDSYVQPFDDETIVTPGSDTSTESSDTTTDDTTTDDTTTDDTTTDDTTTDDTTYSTASTTMYEEDQSDYKFLKKYIKVSQNSKETFSNLPDSSNSHGSWKLYCVVDGEKVDCTDDDGVSFTLVDTDGDGEYDAAQWNVLEGTTEFYIESEITIINVQSYPTVGGEWVVEFTTQGTADLIIRGIDGTFIGPSDDPSTDLVFSKLSDGQRTIHPIVDGNLIIYRDYSSTFEGSLTNHVITAGEHHLEFTFGNNVQVAHNAAFRVDWRQCANFDGGFTLGDCHWIGSIVQSGNAQYFESMSVPQRLIVEGIPPAPSDQHSLTFSVDAAKKNIHAYDFLTS
ncbi:MAG TPA: LamG domain-containing protein, partial [Nitrosopumilus sp.]|nr:LamG domain-containing protein [Nitrosopumilus sp.]